MSLLQTSKKEDRLKKKKTGHKNNLMTVFFQSMYK